MRTVVGVWTQKLTFQFPHKTPQLLSETRASIGQFVESRILCERSSTSHRDIIMQTITPFLWFNDQAEEAVRFYTLIFKPSKVIKVCVTAKAVRAKPAR